MEQPAKILSQPGIKRDGTRYQGENYIDGQWCRFQRGLPRKMGGYRSVTASLSELIHGMHNFSASGVQRFHVGSDSQLNQVRVNNNGTFAGISNRTPVGLSLLERLWQFDVLWVGTSSGNSQIIAHGPPNLSDIDSETNTPFYIGQITDTAPLTELSGIDSLSGGLLVLSPFLLTFGNGGQVNVSPDGDPTSVSDTFFVTGSKIVRGLPVRGSGNGPSGLLWSLDSIILVSFTDLTVGSFGFNTLTASSSVLSSQSIIEYDSIYYWIGEGRFLMFNGVMQELPNTMNLDWFFKNLNQSQKQKVFGYVVPRYGEIHWAFPYGDATECTHEVIYNVRENTWYDTQLPDSGRTAGVFAKIYGKPFLIDNDLTDTGYTFWQHETGVDKVVGSLSIAVPSNFETSELSLMVDSAPSNKSIRAARIEPDFVQSGTLTVQIRGRANARAPIIEGEIKSFPEIAADATQQLVDIKTIRRLLSVKFESNEAGGDYQMGQPLIHIEPADGRVTS